VQSETPAYALHTQVFPTVWETVSVQAPCLFEATKPHVILHFGIAPRARSFRIERCAHNGALPRADASGALPVRDVILPQGKDRLISPLPAAALAAHLRSRGLAAVASSSAGRYLCNFLYYLSLDWIGRQQNPSLALFVHIPPADAQRGSLGRADLLRGANAILHYALTFAETRGADLPSSALARSRQKVRLAGQGGLAQAAD
jgi:pyroglutamyl-peptidase